MNPSFCLLKPFAPFLFSGLLVAGCSTTPPAKPQAVAPEKSPSTPPTHTVARAPAKAKVQLDAVLEATEMAPVKLEPKAWTDLTVLEAVPHGARVRKGDVLVKIDTEKLKEQINETEQDQAAAVLGLELAQFELENLEKTTPLKLEAAKRTQRNSSEDFDYFESTGRAQREKSTKFNLKGAEQRLDGAREELKQLEKMYKADDVTEDTEEIILRRQKFAVESAEYGLETSKQFADLSLKTSIPREAEALKAGRRDQELALALAEQTLPRTLAKKRYETEKLKRDQKKAEKRFADLKKDLDVLDVRAPMDGVVYYGACEAGKWPTGAAVAKKLMPTGKLTPNEVFMTVVNPEKMVLKGVVPESDLSKVKTGMEGQAAPVAAPDKKLPVKLDELGYVPAPTGGFDARLSVKPDPNLRLMPGMNCKVSLGETQKSDALLVPKEAVFAEGGQSFVYVQKSGGESEKRSVKTGEAEGSMVAVTQGLSEGEKVLLKKPE
jgi:HlyD family secretion protein